MKSITNLKGNSLINQASTTLTEFIVSKKVQTGDFLPSEQVLSKQLGVSRSTLREAVKIMESRGLVKKFHGQGIKIVDETQNAASNMLQLSMKRGLTNMAELIETRSIIEVEAASLAAERATPVDLDLIKSALSIMQTEGVSARDYAQADINFHIAVAKATHNNVLLLLLETIRPLLHEVIVATLKSRERLPETVLHYHERIYNAIEMGDKESASIAMRDHLKGTKSLIIANDVNIS